MKVEVRPVSTWQERRQFLNLPWQIYRNNAYWVPPLRRMQKELVGYAKHPFQEVSEQQTFLALGDGKPVGRISAIINHAANRHFDEKRGYWGFFESIDDQAVAHGLFDAVRSWLTERGMTAVRGPANPSMNYECGLLIDGFEMQPTFMMPYHLPYYQQLVESYGWVKAQDLITFIGVASQLDKLDPKLRRVHDGALERFDIQIRPADKRNFQAEIALYLEIYNRSMAGMWGFVPLTEGEIKRIAAELKMLILPELVQVAVVDGKPAGAVLGMPDYNPRIRQIDGRLFPFGWMTLLSRKPFKRFRVISTTVLPEYQMWGVSIVLLTALVPEFLRLNLQEAEFSWVAESNHLSRASLERGGATYEKTHRMYDWPE